MTGHSHSSQLVLHVRFRRRKRRLHSTEAQSWTGQRNHVMVSGTSWRQRHSKQLCLRTSFDAFPDCRFLTNLETYIPRPQQTFKQSDSKWSGFCFVCVKSAMCCFIVLARGCVVDNQQSPIVHAVGTHRLQYSCEHCFWRFSFLPCFEILFIHHAMNFKKWTSSLLSNEFLLQLRK